MDSVRCVNHKIVQTIMHQWLSNPSGRDKSTVSSSVSGGFDHPGIVRWYKCFISQRALFFVHNYHAGAVTFKERFFNNSNNTIAVAILVVIILVVVVYHYQNHLFGVVSHSWYRQLPPYMGAISPYGHYN